MKDLIITEKPSAARAIAEALGGFKKQEKYMENDNYYLTWAVGHLVGLAMPEEYDPELKKWRMNTLPFLPDKFKLKALEKTKPQLNIIQTLSKKADSIIIATDAGREGELIARLILRYLKINLPLKRFWVSSLTNEAIQDGFKNLKPGTEFDNLYKSALCRAQGDFLVGINSSRAFSIKYDSNLSLGRVQTPVLFLLIARQEEIENFIPEPFWELEAEFSTSYKGKWLNENTDRFQKLQEAEIVSNKVQGKEGSIIKYIDKETKEKPPLLYDLTTLQREANRMHSLTAQITLETAQQLYEAKLISYPRTDSRYLTKDLVPKLQGIANKILSIFPGLTIPNQITSKHRSVNDKKVGDHHALIPTGELTKNLKGNGYIIYQMICKRFLIQFYPEAIYREINLITQIEEEIFKTTTKNLLQKGWREVEQNKEIQESSAFLLSLKKGEKVICTDTEIKEKITSPPKHYTEDSLLSAMEKPKLATDENQYDNDMLDLLKEHGLGTPATRAAIMEKLKKIGYIEAKGKSLFPSTKGIELIRLVRKIGVELLTSPELTGEWEKKINDIQKNNYDPKEFIAEIKDLTKEIVDKVKKGQGLSIFIKEDKQSNFKCPLCSRYLREFAKNWSCNGYKQGCNFTVWKEIARKKLTDSQIKNLLEKGSSGLIEGFKSKQGKDFNAVLIIKDGKVQFDFNK